LTHPPPDVKKPHHDVGRSAPGRRRACEDRRTGGELLYPRRIAYLTPLYFDEKSYLGGGERYPLNLALGVVHASRGACEVELVSYGAASLRQPLHPGVTLRVLRAANRPRNILDVLSWELPAAIADADLVHFHTVYCRSCELGLLLAKQQRKPICVSDHGGHSSDLGMSVGFLELADRVVAYSEFGASLIGSKTRTPVTLIKGGVDGARFSPPMPGERSPRDRVLYVGRLLPHKGIDTLIEALPADLPLTICGRPYDEPYYQHLQELAIGKQVEFVTDASDADLIALYRRAYANVLPSVYRDCYGNTYQAPELMGFTLLEAMACGTPAICSRVGGMPEFIREGVTGFVFDTPAELTARLQLLATEAALADRMGAQGRRVVEEEFDLKVAGRQMLQLYEQLMAARREAAA
jgi:glycosyltransferase involved in cell wall biosynthesis